LSAGSRYYGLFLENILFLERLSILERKWLFLERFIFLERFFGYWRATDTLNESPKSFKKSRNKRFVHN
jgi:membrane-bound acyltransferase YfiQ involved in biofilm formation